MSRPHVTRAILSPHFDDAVLSCWHLLTSPDDVQVLDVCTGVPPTGGPAAFWDVVSDGADAAKRMRERRGEDEAALRLAGKSARYLGFLDFQYTGSAPPVEGIVQSALQILEPGTLVYAPLAVGVHPDHLAVRDAGVMLARLGFPLAFYADLPHALRPGWLGRLAQMPRYAGLDADSLVPSAHRLGDDAFAAKLLAVREYRTQLAGLEAIVGGPLDRDDVFRHEVVWTARSADLRQRGGAEHLALPGIA
jgi:LmbE family N-acetylglucosaminyl deacetylase